MCLCTCLRLLKMLIKIVAWFGSRWWWMRAQVRRMTLYSWLFESCQRTAYFKTFKHQKQLLHSGGVPGL